MTLADGVLMLRGGDIAIPPAECETARRAPCIHQKRCSTSAHACTVPSPASGRIRHAALVSGFRIQARRRRAAGAVIIIANTSNAILDDDITIFRVRDVVIHSASTWVPSSEHSRLIVASCTQ